jgi:hypothetical protein
MITAWQMGNPAENGEAEDVNVRYTGQVVYIYAFDLAYDTNHIPIKALLGQPIAEFAVDASKRNPKYLFMHRPQMVRLPPLERIGPHGPVRVERSLKLFSVGAISIMIKIPFQVGKLEELVAYHDVAFSNGDLYTEVRQLAEQVRAELKGSFVRPVPRLEEEEAYTVFCLHSPLTGPDGERLKAESWLSRHRRQVASLLTQEPDVEHLSRQEAEESTGKFLSYYEDDLVVIDWDAGLVVDDPTEFDETLYLMELANLQLAELEAYDRLLDEALDRSYRDLSANSMRSQTALMQELREIRIDLARFNDELSNITKFVGDWHLARLYQSISSRFHLADWHRSIDEKLKTLDDLYQLLSHDRNNRWMMILEVAIVVLFIIDLVMIAFGIGK